MQNSRTISPCAPFPSFRLPAHSRSARVQPTLAGPTTRRSLETPAAHTYLLSRMTDPRYIYIKHHVYQSVRPFFPCRSPVSSTAALPAFLRKGHVFEICHSAG